MCGDLDIDYVVVDSAHAALQQARARDYRVAVVPLRLPVVDGLSLMQHITLLQPQTQCIIVSPTPDDTREHAQSRGVKLAGSLRAPWNAVELREALMQSLGPATATVRGLAVLVVGPPGKVRTTIEKALRAHAQTPTVTLAKNIHEASNHMLTQAFDAVVSELSLEDGQGLEVVRRLCALARGTGVVMVGPGNDEETADGALALGAQDHVAVDELSPRTLWRSIRFARQRKRAEQRLSRLAFLDQLTGVANRSTLYDRMGAAAARAQRHGQKFGLVTADLDGFKAVNDTAGHEAGDAVLQEVARRLESSVRPYDVVARLGGDEFAVLLDEAKDEESILSVCQRIVEVVRQPVDYDGAEHVVRASLGVAIYPDDTTSLTELYDQSDRAMYTAKSMGGDKTVFFSSLDGTSPPKPT